MGADSETSVTRVLAHEGGYVDNPADPGGATNYGITAATARANGYMGRMQDLPLAEAMRIYRARYWQPIRGDDLPPEVRFQVFDAAVNHGVKRAVQWLQAVVGVDQDGVVGPKTLDAANKSNRYALAYLFNAQRLAFYTSLNTWPTFGKGWANRVAENLTYAAGDL